MEVGPPEPPCRGRLQTTLSCSGRFRVGVVSVREKASVKTSCVGQRDERKRTTAEASKKLFGDIKAGCCTVVRDESSGSLLTGWVVSGVEVA